MKKALILFVILFAVTLLIPMISITKSNPTNNEMVTIFNSAYGIVADQFHF